LKILHVFKTYWPDTFGGIERTIDGIARATAPHGVESEVLSLSRWPDREPTVFNGARLTRARLSHEFASTGISLQAFGLLEHAARRSDLIHYHYPWPFMDLLHFSLRTKRPSIVTYHSDIVRQKVLNALYRPLGEAFLRRMDAIVATSPNYLETSPVLRRHRDRTTVIPIGLDRTAYPDPEGADVVSIPLPCPEPYFLFVGVGRYYKGLDVLVEAARLCGLNVVIAGAGDIPAPANVHFVGPVSERAKVRLMRGAAAFVLSSHLRSEAFGLALLEAAMFARPMISCEIGTGTSYINLDRQTGLVVPPGDPAALAAAMREIVDDPVRAESWGAAARARFEEIFTAESMGRRYAELYAAVLAGKPPARPAAPGLA